MIQTRNVRSIFVPAFLWVSLSFASAAQLPDDDVVFKALGDELKRSMSLHLEDLDKPYFIQYGVDDTITYHLAAAYGALLSSDRDHARVLRSHVRVGSHQLDNSNFASPRGGGGSGLAATAE